MLRFQGRMFSFKYFNQITFIPIILFFTSLMTLDVDATSSYKPLSKSAFDEKFQRIVKNIRPNKSQEEELYQIFDLIKENFETWMDFQDPKGFVQIKIGKKTYLSVHPEAEDILIFLKGHYAFISQGSNKKAIKGISFREEKEVAVCYAKSLKYDLNRGKSKGFDLNSFVPLSCEVERMMEGQVLECIQGLPSVVSVYHITYSLREIKGLYLVIVSEYYNGGTLEDLNLDQVSLEERLLIIHDVLQGLKGIHKINVVHNDLLAKNLILEKNLQTETIEGAYLIDFGMSYFSSGEECVDKFQDLQQLAGTLNRCFFSTDTEIEHNPIEQDLMDFFYRIINHNISAKEAYSEFVDLLSWHYDDNIKHQIMRNAK